MIDDLQSSLVRVAPFWPSSPSGPLSNKEILWIEHTFPFLKFIKTPSGLDPGPPQPFSYLAGEDTAQLGRFLTLARTKGIDLLWAVRGGYGSLRWTPGLIKEALPKNSPTVIGFSDVTFLMLTLQKKGMTSIHGPLIKTLRDVSEDTIKSLGLALHKGIFPALTGTSLREGTAEGPLVVGNLSCLSCSIGTPIEPAWEGAILALEDHNEEAYRIDRLITHLLHTGCLQKVAGIAIGNIIPKDHEESGLVERILHERLSRLSCPVVTGLPFGHGPHNLPLLAGGLYRIDGGLGNLEPAF